MTQRLREAAGLFEKGGGGARSGRTDWATAGAGLAGRVLTSRGAPGTPSLSGTRLAGWPGGDVVGARRAGTGRGCSLSLRQRINGRGIGNMRCIALPRAPTASCDPSDPVFPGLLVLSPAADRWKGHPASRLRRLPLAIAAARAPDESQVRGRGTGAGRGARFARRGGLQVLAERAPDCGLPPLLCPGLGPILRPVARAVEMPSAVGASVGAGTGITASFEGIGKL